MRNGAVMPLSDLYLTQLMNNIVQEEYAYKQRGATDMQCSMELFRRAIDLQDALAWQEVYEHYTPMVARWIRSSADVSTLCIEGDAALVHATFERFWHALCVPGAFARFTEASAVFGYLHKCALSAVRDALRMRRRRQCFEEYQPTLSQYEGLRVQGDIAEEVIDNEASEALLCTLQDAAASNKERVLLYLWLECDMLPKEIHLRFPTLFPNIDEIYRLKNALRRRFQRNRYLRAKLALPPRGGDRSERTIRSSDGCKQEDSNEHTRRRSLREDDTEGTGVRGRVKA